MRIVLEGLPGSGKTTHAAAIASKFDLPLIPEWVGLTDRAWRDAGPNVPFYFANDELKEVMGRYFSHCPALFDRHYTGALAYGFALTGLHGEAEDGESYDTNYQWYQHSLEQGKLTRPDLVVMLDISPATSLQRQPRATAFDPLWGDPHALELMRHYYQLFYRQIEPDVQVHWIDAEASTGAVRGEIEQLVGAALQSRASHAFGVT